MTQDRPHQTVGAIFADQARRRPQDTFLRMFGGRAWTYRETWTQARAVAEALWNLGVGHGTPVVVMAPNSPQAVFAWLGANLLGAVDVTINTGYVGATFEHALDQVQARHLVIAAELLPLMRADAPAVARLEAVLVIGWNGQPAPSAPDLALHDFDRQVTDAAGRLGAEIAEPVQIAPRDIASIIYTSGSTGPAKAVTMPHAQVALLAAQTCGHLRLTPDDVVYSFYPLFHMAGKFMLVLAGALAGATVVLDRAFDPASWLARVRESGATVTGAHGPMLEMIHDRPPSDLDQDHRLRAICSAPFPRHIAAAFEERFGVRGLEVWGMTEVGIPLWSSLDEPLRPGSCGRVDRAHYDFAIVDPETDEPVEIGAIGEFVVRPRHPWTLMQGYAGMEQQTLSAWRNLWFHSGDAGYMDEDGYVYFVDRIDDRIRRRAENISSYDIEIAALDHPAVGEAVAVGTPSGFAGDDDIRLFVTARPNALIDPGDLLRHLVDRLPHFMAPRYIETLAALPRGVTQKVQRSALRATPLGPTAWDRKSQDVSLRKIKERP